MLAPKDLLPPISPTITGTAPQKKVIITGISGQDGLYLSAYLLFEIAHSDYEVHGIIRKNSAGNALLEQIQEKIQASHLFPRRNLILHIGDMSDSNFLNHIIGKVQPDELYNLAAQSHVAHSFNNPVHSMDINAMAVLNICQAIVNNKLEKKTKLFQASTSEMFGEVLNENKNIKIDLNFPFMPMSPYSIAKISGYYVI
jgi:GDPmannose 4,6-dehydratase